MADPSTWPAWATEDVAVAEADPRWADAGAALAGLVGAALAPWLLEPVEHVGSTAVPGLAAKPVLDLHAVLGDLGAEVSPLLTAADVGGEWHLVPPGLDARPWRRLHVLVRSGSRAAHLHLVTAGPEHDAVLAFRDALRADEGLRQRYAELKRRLAQGHRGDREGYTAAKTTFVRQALTGGG